MFSQYDLPYPGSCVHRRTQRSHGELIPMISCRWAEKEPKIRQRGIYYLVQNTNELNTRSLRSEKLTALRATSATTSCCPRSGSTTDPGQLCLWIRVFSSIPDIGDKWPSSPGSFKKVEPCPTFLDVADQSPILAMHFVIWKHKFADWGRHR